MFAFLFSSKELDETKKELDITKKKLEDVVKELNELRMANANYSAPSRQCACVDLLGEIKEINKKLTLSDYQQTYLS